MQKILIVDDDLTACNSLRMILKSLKYQVDTFHKGEDSVEYCKNENPDLILMDINLSGKMNGIDAVNAIAAEKDIPVIFMTGLHKDDEITDKIIKKSSSGYITKPINVNYLNVMIKMTIERHNILKKSDETSKRLQLATQILELLNHLDDTKETISDILFVIKKMTNFSSVAIRIFFDDSFYYFDSIGLDESFTNIKKNIQIKKYLIDDRCSDCWVKQILSGSYDSRKPFFTTSGSFWTNNLEQLVMDNFNNINNVKIKCLDFGYKSIAVIPIKSNNKFVGLFHLNDKRPNMLNRETILFFERISMSIGITLERQKNIFNIQEAYKKSNLLERIINKSSVVTIRWELKDKWKITFISDSIKKYGYSPNDFYSNKLKYKDIVYPDDIKSVLRKVSQFLNDNSTNLTITYRLKTKDGKIVWVDDLTWKEFDKNGNVIYLYGLLTDITEKHKIYKAIEENELFLNNLLEGLNAGVLVVNPETYNIVNVNEQATKILSRKQDELLGKFLFNLINLDKEKLNNRKINQEIYIELPDNTFKATSLTIIKTNWKGKQHIIIVLFDITKQKNMEMQLQFAQKMESIGQLAGGIAHEINTPVQYIGDNSHFVKDSFESVLKILDIYKNIKKLLKEKNMYEDMINKIEYIEENEGLDFILSEIPVAMSQSIDGVNKVSKIVRAMKKFAHPGKEEKVFADINDIIENTITIAKNEWKYVADVEFTPSPDFPQVPCSIGDINQVFLNIIVNAAHAIKDVVKNSGEKGKIKISTEVIDNYAVINISDTGTGIPENIRNKIFEPFFTTKEVGKGTGQGLSLVHSIIVEKHKGEIEVQSEVGKGTTFSIFLPLEVSE